MECDNCFNERMVAASLDRILSGSGLTWSNVAKFDRQGSCPHAKDKT